LWKHEAETGEEDLEEANATRGTTSGMSRKNGTGGTDSMDAQTLEATTNGVPRTRKCSVWAKDGKWHGGQDGRFVSRRARAPLLLRETL
jgi:hypothetical protein